MKILANVTLTKLKEYSQSYGGAETIDVAFIKDFGHEIHLLADTGRHIRTMRTGTRLLISFSGTEISERTFKLRTNKAIRAAQIQKEESEISADITNQNRIAKVKAVELAVLKKLTEQEGKAEKWINSNEGNAHTRRTRWANRATRMGFDHSFLGVVRDTTYAFLNKDPRFFINGIINPEYLK